MITRVELEPADDMAVTVIGGYLGAGKTTLLNHILRTSDQRVAVLVNDFGDINIDADLIADNDGETMSLANGCICCSLVDGFSSALATIDALEPRPERLVIEASGVADPASVAAYGHGPGFRLDAVVVVVDAETVRGKADDVYVGDTVIGQLRSGDIIVVNKVDLVDGRTDAIRAWLHQVNPQAVVIEATDAVVDPALLFGDESFLDRPRPAPAPAPDHAGDHGGHDHGAHAGSLFESWSWSSDRPIRRTDVETLMDTLPDSIVRAKGVLWLVEEPDRAMVLHRVGRRWTLRPLRPWTGERAGRLVVIGLHGTITDTTLTEALG